MNTIHTYTSYDERERALEHVVTDAFRTFCESWGGMFAAGIGGALHESFSESDAPPPIEFGQDGGRIDCFKITPYLAGWLYSDQAGGLDAFIVEIGSDLVLDNMRGHVASRIAQLESEHVLVSPRTHSEDTVMAATMVPVHIWHNEEVGDVNVSPAHMDIMPPGVYVENTRGGYNGGSFFVGPFHNTDAAMLYWKETGIYDGEKLAIMGAGYTAS